MPSAIVLAILAFLIGYPVLQYWTLVRCRGLCRRLSLACLLLAAPLYGFTLWDLIAARSGSLWGIVVVVLGPVPVLGLALLAIGYEVYELSRRPAAGVPPGDPS